MKRSRGKHNRTAGAKLLQIRSDAGLTMRDVAAASATLAHRLGNPAYKLSIARLSAYEAKGTVPNIFAVYTLSKTYGQPLKKLLRLYAIPV